RLNTRVAAIAVVVAEATQIHAPDVDRGAPLEDPLSHDTADAACARDSVSAESGGDEEAAHVRRLAQDELAVRRERLGAVDQRDDLGAADGRHARDRLLHQVTESLPVRRQQLVGEVWRDPVEPPRRGRALVAAHEESPDLFTKVDEA